MPPFDFDQLRDITREATRRMRPSRPGEAEGGRADREAASASLDDHAVDALLDELRRFQDSCMRTPRPSHRKFVGPVVGFVKRVGFRLVRPLVHEAFETQVQFNESAFELLSHLVEERRRLRVELAQLRADERRE